MVRKSHYDRKQVKHRKDFGNIENKHEMRERVGRIKEFKKKIKEAKSKILDKTGKEYFFKYNSIKKEEDELLVEEKDTIDELIKKKIYVEKELFRIDKLIKEFIPANGNKKIVFDDEGNAFEAVNECEFNSSIETKNEYEKYSIYQQDLKNNLQQITKLINIQKQ